MHTLDRLVYVSKPRRDKMKQLSHHLQLNQLAKQGGLVPSYWSAIEMMTSDRTPSNFISRVREGWDD